jgi:hypothetical protein
MRDWLKQHGYEVPTEGGFPTGYDRHIRTIFRPHSQTAYRK